jgi:hypothetical protein
MTNTFMNRLVVGALVVLSAALLRTMRCLNPFR